MFTEALTLCTEALDLFPRSVDLIECYINLALTTAQGDCVKHGIDLFMQLHPSQWETKSCVAILRMLAINDLPGSTDTARKLIDKRQPFYPAEETFYLEYAFKDASGDHNAPEILQSAINQFNAPLCSQALANVYIEHNEPEKAREIVKNALPLADKESLRLLFLFNKLEEAELLKSLNAGIIPAEKEFERPIKVYRTLSLHFSFCEKDKAIEREIGTRLKFLETIKYSLYPEKTSRK